MAFVSKNGKGLLLCLCIALPAWILGKQFPIIGGPIIAILAGMIVTIFIKDKTNFSAGIKFTS
ncbi:MAG: putative sulfate exporter family transporter, partial [Firmicutes bacterium]|nr:putative sulfate exporter family transporter [Bacillota bacterium]